MVKIYQRTLHAKSTKQEITCNGENVLNIAPFFIRILHMIQSKVRNYSSNFS